MIAIPTRFTFLRTGKRLSFPFTESFPGRPADFEPPFGTVEEIPYLLTTASFMVGVSAPHFKLDHPSVAAVCLHSAVHHPPGGPGLAFLLVKSVETTGTMDRNRVFVQVHSPAGK